MSRLFLLKKIYIMKKNQEINDNDLWRQYIPELQEIAKKNNITHEQIAKEINLHRSCVTRFFAQKHCPNMNTFILIAKVLKIKVLKIK